VFGHAALQAGVAATVLSGAQPGVAGNLAAIVKLIFLRKRGQGFYCLLGC
jgi:hypothetical protein